MTKSHLLFRNPSEGVVTYKPRLGGGNGNNENEDDNEAPDYEPMANEFRECVNNFNWNIQLRHDNRILELDSHFDLIEITFQGSFNQEKFQSHYIAEFGIEPIRFSLFNKKGLFAIEDEEKFRHFLNQINNFIARHIDDAQVNYDGKIRFIRNFKLLTTNDMIGNIDNYDVVHLSFLNGQSFIEESHIVPQKRALVEYLESNNIEYSFNRNDGEVYHIDNNILRVLLNNFDFIYASCSGSGAIIQPSTHNTPHRDYGFEITNIEDDLPIIGVIDSGISKQTPLAPIIVGEENEFNTTSTSSFIDNADHGTGVAAFAAFGTKLIPDYRGEVEADAKVLPIKIIDDSTGSISQQKTIELIRRAHNDYGVRIFTLTIGYTNFPLKDNEEYSSYARMLDEITSELDILIFISTTNNNLNINNRTDYPDKFLHQSANIAPPAESMNNITIGASANNYELDNHRGLAYDKDFPAIYSRKFHYNFDDTDAFNQSTSNKHLKKPDILIGGGDFSEYNIHGINMYVDDGSSCLEVLSSDLSERTIRKLGTSYSTPLAANLAARLLKMYPNLNMQTIKAMLINSSNELKLGDTFNNFSNFCKNRILGHGTPFLNTLYNSNDDVVTLIIEDTILPNHIKTFPIHLPDYLRQAKRMNSLLKISSTLAFKFNPKPDNQLLYCPLHLTFAIGKNLNLEESEIIELVDEETGEIKSKNVEIGYNGNSSKMLKISASSTGWVQDFYYRNKIVSNVQKSIINVSKQNIIDENGSLKIAINSAFHKQLTEAERRPYQDTPISYSLVITIEQNPVKKETLNSLYEGLVAINTLEAIAVIELEAELNG
ncbi:MAG: S8 family serine peptidase [Breznakibacter sp.]